MHIILIRLRAVIIFLWDSGGEARNFRLRVYKPRAARKITAARSLNFVETSCTLVV